METKLTWDQYKSFKNEIKEYESMGFIHRQLSVHTFVYEIAHSLLVMGHTRGYMEMQITGMPDKDILNNILAELPMEAFLSKREDINIEQNPEYAEVISDSYEKIKNRLYGYVRQLQREGFE